MSNENEKKTTLTKSTHETYADLVHILRTRKGAQEAYGPFTGPDAERMAKELGAELGAEISPSTMRRALKQSGLWAGKPKPVDPMEALMERLERVETCLVSQEIELRQLRERVGELEAWRVNGDEEDPCCPVCHGKGFDEYNQARCVQCAGTGLVAGSNGGAQGEEGTTNGTNGTNEEDGEAERIGGTREELI